MSNSSELVTQASSTPLVDHSHWVTGKKNRTVCFYSYKAPPGEVTTQLLAENKGVHEVALTKCVCGTIFRFYPHGGRGLKGAWRITTIEPRKS